MLHSQTRGITTADDVRYFNISSPACISRYRVICACKQCIIITAPYPVGGLSLVLKQGVRCRWGYKHVEELADVVAKYRAADIPLEVMWTDIDYMDGYRDFSLDPNNFSKDKMQASPTHLTFVLLLLLVLSRGGACKNVLCSCSTLISPCCQACS